MRTNFRIGVIAAVLLACGACGSNKPAPAAPPRLALPPPVTASAAPPPPPPNPYPDDTDIAKAVDAYLDLYVEIHPEHATSLGLHAHDDQLDDRSIAGHDKATQRESDMLDGLEKRFATPKASPGSKTDLALLIGALRVDVRTRRVMRPAPAPARRVHRPARLDLPDHRPRLRARAGPREERARADREAPPERRLREGQPPQSAQDLDRDRDREGGEAKSFLADQKAFLTENLPDQTARVDAALKAATTAFDDYVKLLQTDIMKRSNGRFSAGRELFDYLLQNDDFIDENADQVLATGKRVFAETNKQMADLAQKIDPKAKNWWDVTKRIKSKHPAADDLIASYAKEAKKARAFLIDKDAVPFPPGDDLEVIETPSFMRATTSAAYDAPPPFDDHTTKGFFFVTPVDKSASPQKQEEWLRENDFADIVDTTVHEAYPGHHLQLSWARRNPSKARRAFDHAIMEEGWALYSEELMSELGYYSDDERLIQLEWTLVRAARIVIDVGLHASDMTYEQAVKMLTDEVHLEKALATEEVKRYTEDPTQPSSYILGREKIMELREKVKQRDGAKFTLKGFHTDLLTKGSVPPSLAAREILAAPQ